jgi:DNA uptake protein ComE-like DNA-binding protein
MKSTALAISTVSAFLVLTTALTTTAPATAAGPDVLPPGEGKAIVERMCVNCHALSVVTSKRATPEQWSTVVATMVSRGAEGTDEEIDTVTRYLATNFGPDRPSSNSPSAEQSAATESQAAPSDAPPGAPAATTPSMSHETAAPVTSEEDETVSPEPAPSSIHVNVNRAMAPELASKLSLTIDEAETLIRYRKQNGNFQNWQEVGEVPGVPAGKIQEYRARIVF